MYQQYLADPSSVDQAWHEFFADYRPGSPVGGADRPKPTAAGAGDGQALQEDTAEAKPAPPKPAQQEPAAQPPAAKPAESAPAAKPAPEKPIAEKPAAEKPAAKAAAP